MAISKLNPVSTSTVNGSAYVVPTAGKQYKITTAFKAGVYSITVSPTSSTTIISFYNESGITLATTASGVVSVNLATDAAETYVQSSVNSDLVTITQVANSIPGTEISGTLDTITSTGTYAQTGKLYVMCVGGGTGGTGGGGSSDNTAGAGGNAGTIAAKLVYTTSSTSVTIGTGGAGGAGTTAGAAGVVGTAGGTTTFGALVSAGVATSTGGASGGYGSSPGGAGVAVSNVYTSIKSGTNGGGGGGGGPTSSTASAGAGSGIGTGGAGGQGTGGSINGSNATGYGSGGGGGAGTGTTGGNGGNGSAGVIYVLRGF